MLTNLKNNLFTLQEPAPANNGTGESAEAEPAGDRTAIFKCVGDNTEHLHLGQKFPAVSGNFTPAPATDGDQPTSDNSCTGRREAL